MQWPVALVASILLTGQAVSAGLTRDIVHSIRRDDSAAERLLRRKIASLVDEDIRDIQTRAVVAGSTSLNSSEWETQVLSACTSSLSNLATDATNPSGMALCYNLPMLDSTTGKFTADMRLYKVANATGSFAGLAADSVQVSLSYSGAMVQPTNGSLTTTTAKRELYSLISWPNLKRDFDLEERASNAPVLTQSYAFTGQINANAMTSNMTTAQFEAAVLPTVTLSAMSSGSSTAKTTTNLNSTQASFLIGAFSKKAASTGSSAAAVAQTSSTSTATPTGVFILPGTKILIFPVGAIVTGAWTLLFCVAVGYGTFGRIQFRDQYRRQSARMNAGGVSRI